MKISSLIGAFLLMLTATAAGIAQDDSLPNGDAIAERMAAHDSERQLVASGYHGMRRYVLDNERTHKHAEIVVRVDCGADGAKHFELVSEQGWKGAYKHVVDRMLKSEAEASKSETKFKTRITLDNYEFRTVRSTLLNDRAVYVIDLIPKRNEERLITGQAWIDAQDYAIARVEGAPAKNPSFWVQNVHFVHTYHKDGQLWFPETTESLSDARIFGATSLTIHYFDYIPNQPSAPETATAAIPGGLTQ